MKTAIFAGATARIVRDGESVEDAWEWITAMFKQPRPYDAKSFMPGGFYVEPEKQSNPLRGVSTGDVYKGSSRVGTDVFVDITRCVPHKFLSYTEQYWEAELADKATPSIMQFSISEHPKGALVRIDRAEKQLHSIKSRLFSAVTGGFDGDTAVGRLAFILENRFAKGASFEGQTCQIERDDSLKALFG
ncbi:MAG: hypothetical protein AAFX06_32585 [Planctomycetota bacterium]